MDADWIIDVMRRLLAPGFTLEEARRIFRDEGRQTDPATVFFAPRYGNLSRVILKSLKLRDDYVPAVLHIDLEPHQALNLPRLKAVLGPPVEGPRMKPDAPRCFQIDVEPRSGLLGGDLALDVVVPPKRTARVSYIRFQRHAG